MISQNDISVGIIAQTDPLVAPTTGRLLMLDYIPGSMMTTTAEAIESPTLKPNGDAGGSRPGNITVTGQFKMRLKRSEAQNLIWASVLGNEWSDDVLVTGTKKVPIMIVQTYNDPDADEEDASSRDQFLGCEVVKITSEAVNSAGLELTVDFTGLKSEVGLSGVSPLSAVADTQELEMIGDDVQNVSVSGTDIDAYTQLSFSVEQERTPKHVLGSSVAKGLVRSAARKITGSLSWFRVGGVQPSFTGAGQTLSFDLLDAYGFVIPAAHFDLPADQINSGSLERTANFVASYDNALKTAMKITRSKSTS